MIRDLIFMAAYRTGNATKRVNNELALFEKKIDLLQSYGWDINAADDAGNEPLHYIFKTAPLTGSTSAINIILPTA